MNRLASILLTLFAITLMLRGVGAQQNGAHKDVPQDDVAHQDVPQEDVAQRVLAEQLRILKTAKDQEPAILRLDLELESLVAAGKKREDGGVEYVAAGLSPQHGVYRTFGMPNLGEFARFLLGKASYPAVDLRRNAFAERDLSAEIVAAYRRCVELNGKPLPKAPIYKVAIGFQKATNAQMQGFDRRLGRHVIILNRSALAQGRHWDAAIIHETWHCFQESMATKKSLLARSLHEGIVTHLTQVADPTLDAPTVMLWSRQEWQAAEKRRAAIVKAFARRRTSSKKDDLSPFMYLGVPLKEVPGAPSRCGYYVGYLAARAWRAAHPEKSIADMLAAPDTEFWSALEEEEARRSADD